MSTAPGRRGVGERIAAGESRRRALEGALGTRGVVPASRAAFPSRLHDERIAAILGLALGIAFAVCFATGLVSHLAQHPLDLGLLSMPAEPAWLYRVTQGVHVATGTAAVPLLLAKLWTVYPLLFAEPPVRNAAHLVARIALVPLVAGAIFLLGSGLVNITGWYPWSFSFPVAHYFTAWMVMGALLVHVGAIWAPARRGLSRAAARAPEPPGDGLSRRGFLGAVAAAAGAVTLLTAGQTVRPLRGVSLLAPRDPAVGPQGLPVNKTAIGAGVIETARDPGFALVVDGDVARPLRLSLADLEALPQHEAELPIACVEGWSASARWGGVRVRDLLELAGAGEVREVRVSSLQERGSFRASRLNAIHAAHEDTLLALRIGDAPLALDHGFPCRLIAPNRPGVQQTKWVARLEVRA